LIGLPGEQDRRRCNPLLNGLLPQSAATLDALLCMQIKSCLPFSKSNPQFKPTGIIMGDCPEPDEELGNHRYNLSKAGFSLG